MSENPPNQGIPPWKRPWTLEEIRLGSSSWSLASDAGLYLFLEKMGEELKSSTSNVEKDVRSVIRDSKEINVQIQNAFNDFCMLANNQFIENLVEDDSSSIQEAKTTEDGKPPKTKEERQAELLPFVKQSLQLGLKVLETQYERVEVKTDRIWTEDDDDLEMTKSSDPTVANGGVKIEPIYEPRDPYEHRHLPHLIGSSAFKDDDTLGIGFIDDDDMEEIPEEEEATDEDDDDSLSEGERRSRKLSHFSSVSSFTTSSSSGSDQESKKRKSTKSEAALSKKAISRRDTNLFGETDSDSDMSDSFDDALSSTAPSVHNKKSKKSNADETATAVPNNLADELKRKLATPNAAPEGPQSPSLLPSHKSKSRSHTKSSIISSNPAPAAPSEDSSDDDNIFGRGTSLFNPKSTLFTSAMGDKKSSGLFDDEEDEEDDFKLPPPRSNTVSSQVKTNNFQKSKPVSDDEEDDDLFSQVAKTQSKAQTQRPPAPNPPVSSHTSTPKPLIIDKSHQSIHRESKPSSGGVTSRPAVRDLFDELSDDNEDLFLPKSTTKKAAPSGNKTSLPPPTIKTNKVIPSGIFSDEEEENDLFASKPKTNLKPNEATKREPESNQKVSNATNSRFSTTDEEDDLFSILPKKDNSAVKTSEPNVEQPQTSQRKKPAGAVSMFGGVDPFAITRNSVTNIKETSKQEEEEEDASNSTPPKDQPETSPKSILTPNLPKRNTFSSEESDGDDLFATKKTTASSIKPSLTTTVTKSFADEEDDLFGDSKPAKQPPLHQSNVPPKSSPMKTDNSKPKVTKDLFSEEEEEDDLFSTTKKSDQPKPNSAISVKKEDKDDLFGSMENPPNSKNKGLLDSQPSPLKDDVNSTPTDSAAKQDNNFEKEVKGFFAPAKSGKEPFNSTDDEDDLFATTKKPSPGSITDNKEKPQHAEKPPPDQGDVLVSQQPAETTKPTFKRPSGGVSMFGGPGNPVGLRPSVGPTAGASLAKEMKARLKARAGLDPNAASSSSSSEENETEPSEERRQSKKVFVPPPGAVSMFGGPPLGGIPRKTEASNEPEVGTSFEAPIESNDDKLLTTATKARPRPSMNRKRPSRFASSANSSTPQVNDTSAPSDVKKPPEVKDESEDIFTVPKQTVKPSSIYEDIFSDLKVTKVLQNDNEDIFATISPQTGPPSAKIDEEDIFATSVKPKSGKQQPEAKSNDSDEDIFGSANIKAKSKEHSDSSGQMKKAEKVSTILDSDEEDLFNTATKERPKSGPKSAPNKSAAAENRSQKKANPDTLFNDDTDIFSDLPIVTKSSKSSKAGTAGATRKKSSAPPVITDDIDDIFATPKAFSSTTKKKTKKSQETIKPKATPVTEDPLGPLG